MAESAIPHITRKAVRAVVNLVDANIKISAARTPKIRMADAVAHIIRIVGMQCYITMAFSLIS